MELAFSTNFVGVFADLHNFISEMGANTAQKACANKSHCQRVLLILGGFRLSQFTVKQFCRHISYANIIAL